MGGSYIDSSCRLVWTAVSLTAFSYYAFYAATTYREDNGLLDCYTMGDLEKPISKDSLLY